jgi:hypothetical protein
MLSSTACLFACAHVPACAYGLQHPCGAFNNCCTVLWHQLLHMQALTGMCTTAAFATAVLSAGKSREEVKAMPGCRASTPVLCLFVVTCCNGICTALCRAAGKSREEVKATLKSERAKLPRRRLTNRRRTSRWRSLQQQQHQHQHGAGACGVAALC